MPTQSSILSHSGSSSEKLRSSEDVIVRIAPEKIVSFSVERSVANYTIKVATSTENQLGGASRNHMCRRVRRASNDPRHHRSVGDT